jgi:lipoprotein-anchoring transpeptidase ErfK/SrfK
MRLLLLPVTLLAICLAAAAQAQYATPFSLRNIIPDVEDAEPGQVPAPEAKAVPEIYRRQPVFYRTSEAPGTIIIDTSERFLYLIQPNNVRYATALASGATASNGAGCSRSHARRNGRTGRRRPR